MHRTAKEDLMYARSIALAAAILLGLVGFVEARQPTISDIAICNEEATKETSGSAFPGPRPGPEIARENPNQKGTRDMPDRGGTGSAAKTGEKTDPSGSFITESSDPFVTGMDAGKADDSAYRTAYRDCMRRRIGPGR
jgi:hypothetical protein